MLEVTKVIFRKDKTGEVTAVFPEVPASHTTLDSYSCYSHLGQHSSCCYEWYRQTKPATPEEYASLKQELESAPYWYNLEVIQKMSNETYQQRKTAWKAWQRIPASF